MDMRAWLVFQAGCNAVRDAEPAPNGDAPMFRNRTGKERRLHTIQAIMNHPEYSDRRLARLAAVSREVIVRTRKKLTDLKQVEPRIKRLGTDGKAYRATHVSTPLEQPQS